LFEAFHSSLTETISTDLGIFLDYIGPSYASYSFFFFISDKFLSIFFDFFFTIPPPPYLFSFFANT